MKYNQKMYFYLDSRIVDDARFREAGFLLRSSAMTPEMNSRRYGLFCSSVIASESRDRFSGSCPKIYAPARFFLANGRAAF
jgi:hypothetical protein